MLLNEIAAGSSVELTALIGTQKLEFQTASADISLDDKRLAKELNRFTKNRPYLAVPAIRQNGKVIGLPTSGVVYQLVAVNKADHKAYIWPNISIRQIRLQDQEPNHLFISDREGKEYNRRQRYRLWLGVSGIATIGLRRKTFDVTIKDISSTGIGFIIQNRLLEENGITLVPRTLVVLSFFDPASESNFRINALVVRQSPADEGRTMVGCIFSEENRTLSEFIAKRQREKLKEQRGG